MADRAAVPATDVVVVGAGGCGLTAALVASHLGARVTLLEKTDRVGGGTALSGRRLQAANGPLVRRRSGDTSDPERYAQEILERNGHNCDEDVLRALTEGSGEVIAFLADHAGVEFTIEDTATVHAWSQAHGWTRDAPLTDLLYEAVQRDPGIEVRLSTSAHTLLQRPDGTVEGVVLDDGSTILARRVILASGGFGGSPEMVARYLPKAAGIPHPGHPANTGDGIRMGLDAGGVVDHMGAFQPFPFHIGPGKRSVPPLAMRNGGIVVDAAGRRITDETRYPGPPSAAILDLPDRRAWAILDRHAYDAHRGELPVRSLALMVADGVMRTAPTLAELAGLLGIDADGLEATGRSFDAHAVAGTADEFGRTPRQTLDGPYYGAAITVSLYQTLGGLRVDRHGQVLHADGSSVPGLYAGGAVAAGFAGDGPDGYLPGTGLLASFGLGRLAAIHAVESLAEPS